MWLAAASHADQGSKAKQPRGRFPIRACRDTEGQPGDAPGGTDYLQGPPGGGSEGTAGAGRWAGHLPPYPLVWGHVSGLPT